MAVRTRIDIFTENVRKITYIDSDHFGTVAFGAVGAMMVGSIRLTSERGQRVNRMDEHGYFAFGGMSLLLLMPVLPFSGSTCMLLFEKGKIKFDEDLLENSRQGLETLVKVGNSLGRVP